MPRPHGRMAVPSYGGHGWRQTRSSASLRAAHATSVCAPYVDAISAWWRGVSGWLYQRAAARLTPTMPPVGRHGHPAMRTWHATSLMFSNRTAGRRAWLRAGHTCDMCSIRAGRLSWLTSGFSPGTRKDATMSSLGEAFCGTHHYGCAHLGALTGAPTWEAPNAQQRVPTRRAIAYGRKTQQGRCGLMRSALAYIYIR